MKKVLIGLGVLVAVSTVLFAATTNMGLDLPVVGSTTGPAWATMINQAFQVVDSHSHAPGSGVQISNAGVSTSAAIARSKLASGGGSLVLINDTAGVMSSETTLAVQRGGTNLSGYTAGDILYASSPTALSKLPIGTSSQVLKVATGLPSWATLPSNTAPTIQKFLSSSGTYTTPTFPSPIYIVVEMVGGGGGGAARTSNGGATGGNSTFAGMTASGGVGGNVGASLGGAGGAASLGSQTGLAIAGASGGSGLANTTIAISAPGGTGGNSYFGGGGGGGAGASAGQAAATNSGSGGGGAGSVGSTDAGSGGGAGGYVTASISSLSATYAYAVGAAGAGGAAGTVAGGSGAAGFIIVYEYY